MKRNIFGILVFITLNSFSQENINVLHSKTFISNVGSICEETPEPDPCAGQRIYLVLEFKKEEVFISEKYISSCDKEEVKVIGNYKWEVLAHNEVKIYANLEEVKYTFLENVVFILKNSQLIGQKKTGNNKPVEYVFEDILDKK